MLGSLTFMKHFQFAKCFIHDRRQSLFIFKVLSKDWIIQTAWARLALCQALIRLPPLSSFFQMGRTGRMTRAARGLGRERRWARVHLLPVSSFLSCHLFFRRVVSLGLCSHLEDTSLWLTSGWLCKSKEVWKWCRLSLASAGAVRQMAAVRGKRLGCAQSGWQPQTARTCSHSRGIPMSLSRPS